MGHAIVTVNVRMVSRMAQLQQMVHVHVSASVRTVISRNLDLMVASVPTMSVHAASQVWRRHGKIVSVSAQRFVVSHPSVAKEDEGQSVTNQTAHPTRGAVDTASARKVPAVQPFACAALGGQVC